MPIANRPLILAATAVFGLAADGLVLRSVITAPSRPAASAQTFPTLQGADGAITSIMIERPVATLWSEVRNSPDLAGNIDRAAATIQAAGKALQRGVADDLAGVDTVRFVFRAEAVDRFGHDVMAPLITVDLALADLKAADYAALPPARLLGLARTVKMGSPGSYDAVSAWCQEAGRAHEAFCAKVATL